MILYHGSYLEIKKPEILKSKRLLDFGTGFYLTTDFEQASRWAKRKVEIVGNGTPTVSSYEFDDKNKTNLNVLEFDSPEKEWLEYVSLNRSDETYKDSYDLVIGPVANDQAYRTINNYINGYFDDKMAITLLLPQKLKDQYVFKSEKALSLLNFKESKNV